MLLEVGVFLDQEVVDEVSLDTLVVGVDFSVLDLAAGHVHTMSDGQFDIFLVVGLEVVDFIVGDSPVPSLEEGLAQTLSSFQEYPHDETPIHPRSD